MDDWVQVDSVPERSGLAGFYTWHLWWSPSRLMLAYGNRGLLI